MPGLLGFVPNPNSPDAQDQHSQALEQVIGQMVRPLKRKPWQQAECRVAQGAAFAAVHLQNGPAFHQQAGLLLGMHGEIYDLDALRTRLLTAGDGQARRYALPEALLALYLKFGVTALTGLNGVYVISIWDEQARQLTLVNDRLGLGRLVYWHTPEGLMFAPEVKCIAWHPQFDKKIDTTGLFDLIAIGHYLDERTVYEAVHVLPAAQIAVFENGKLHLERYWSLEISKANEQTGSEAELVDEMDYRLRQAVSRRLDGPATLLLTAGLDSRILAGEMAALGVRHPLRAWTLGAEDSAEVVYARQIAGALGIGHERIPLAPNYLEEQAEYAAWALEGNMSAHASWIFEARPALEKRTVQRLVSGVGGDAVTGRLRIDGVDCASTEEEAINQLIRRPSWNYEAAFRLFRPEIGRHAGRNSAATLARSFHEAKAEGAVCKFDCVLFEQMFRRYVTGMDSLGDYARVAEPFFDNDFFDFALHLPPQWRLDGRLFKTMILRRYAHLTGAGYGKNHKPLNHTLNRELSSGFQKGAYRLWDGFSRRARLLRPPVRRPTPGRVVLYDEWFRGPSRDFVLRTLAQSEYLADLFDMARVQQVIDEHMNGARHFKLISGLLTVSLLRQKFD